MFVERRKCPSFVLAVWTGAVLLFFVLRGDLRVATGRGLPPESQQASAPANERQAPQPVVVKSHAPLPPPKNVDLQGRVFDAMGFLLVGAEVPFTGAATGRTDADGSFRVTVAADSDAAIQVSAPGHCSEWLRLRPVSPDPLLVQLSPAAPWDREIVPPAAELDLDRPHGEGIVRDEAGLPLANAFVTQVGAGAAGDCWARTDEFGRYALPLAIPQVGSLITLLIHEPDGLGGRGHAFRSEPIAMSRTTGTLPLPDAVAGPAAAIRGTVRDERGNPVAGVPIELRAGEFVRITETGGNGMFRVGGLLPANYTVRPFAWRGSFGAERAVAVGAPITDCELQLHGAEDRRLRVVDEAGQPVGLAYVASSIGGRRRSVERADAEGWATVRSTSDATFEVRAGDDFRQLPVRRFDAERSVLCVVGE